MHHPDKVTQRFLDFNASESGCRLAKDKSRYVSRLPVAASKRDHVT